jgi:tetratricopeptide (TPR) repeat protein
MSKAKINKTKHKAEVTTGRLKAASLPDKMLVELYLQRSIVVLACFVLFLPLIVDYRFYFPHIFFKSILFRTTVQAMAVLYVILALFSPEYRPRFTRFTWVLAAYFGIVVLCSLPGISINPWYSWWGDFVHMGGVFGQLHLFFYFFVLVQTLKQEKDWLVLFTASIFFAAFMGMTGLMQSLGFDEIFRYTPQEPRIHGATGNSGYFGTYMLLNFFIALYFLIRKNRKEIYPFIAKIWLIILIAFDLFLIITRAQLLSTGLALFSMVVFAVLLHGTSLLWFFMRHNSWSGTVFLSFLSLYFLFWMYQSQTRAVLIGLVASLVLLSAFYILTGASRRLKWSAAFLILLVAMLPPILYSSRNSSWIKSYPTIRRLARTSLEEHRFMAWRAASRSILDRPFLGWGLENYRNAFDRHAPAETFAGSKPENWYDRAHSLILDIGTTAGLLGLGAYLSFHILIFAFLISSWFRTKDNANSILIAALILAYLIQGLFTFDTINTDGIVFLVFAFIVFLFGKAKSDLPDQSVPMPVPLSFSGQKCLILAATIAILIAANFYTVQKPYKANLLLQKGIAFGKDKDSQTQTPRYVFRREMLDAFQEAEELQTTGRYEVREAFANYIEEMAKDSHIPIEDRVLAAKRAIAFLDKSLLEEPLTVRHYMYFSMIVRRVFGIIGQSDPRLANSLAEKNISQLEKAETLAPTRWRIPLERAQTLGFIGRMDDAIPALKRAISLNPTIATPYVELIAIYIASGHYRDAEIEWQKIKALSLPVKPLEYEKMIRLYVSGKQFAQVVALQKDQIQSSPDDAQLWVNLAVAFRELGDMDSARQAAKKAANLSPKIAEGLGDFLKSLENSASK